MTTAEEVALRDLLRDGLYTEEVGRDPEGAAKQYEEIISRYNGQRDFAAAALFRLAEVRRKQDRKEDAVKLYQRLIVEFPGAETETRLARENLLALGGDVSPRGLPSAQVNPEAAELARLKAAAVSSPDILLDPVTLGTAANSGYPSVVKFLLEKGGRPLDGYALTAAAKNGNLEIVKLLLESAGPVPEAQATRTIMDAIKGKRFMVLEFLLNSGMKPGLTEGDLGQIPVLAQALLTMDGQIPSAEILLKHGVDINEMVTMKQAQSTFQPDGTVLALAVYRGKFEEAKWLLAHGAQVQVLDRRTGMTALHLAATNDDPGCLEMMKLLLEAGADPNFDPAESLTDQGGNSEGTPLATALWSSFQAPEKVKLLLEHGADVKRRGARIAEGLAKQIAEPNSNAEELVKILGAAGAPLGSPDLVQACLVRKLPGILEVLLAHGADPNGESDDGDIFLAYACNSGSPDLLKLLLEAGGNPQVISRNGLSLLQLAATSQTGNGLECMRLLADAGGVPDEAWAAKNYADTQRQNLRFLLDRFVIPGLAKQGGIHLVLDHYSSLNTFEISDGSFTAGNPNLGSWLLENESKLEFFMQNNKRADYSWKVWRTDPGGVLREISFDLLGKEKLPELQAKDVVECYMADEKSGGSVAGFVGLDSATTRAIRNRISFPVTMAFEGKTREITMRGDRLFYDPSKDEMPLGSLQDAARLLLQPGYTDDNTSSLLMLIVRRKGWPELRIEFGSPASKKTTLIAGDHLEVEISPEHAEVTGRHRKTSIMIEGSGFSYRLRLANGWDRKSSPIEFPTLFQALVETQIPRLARAWSSHNLEEKFQSVSLDDKGKLRPVEDIFGRIGTSGFTSVPFPDLSNIQIRRLQEDGQEAIIEVDLVKAIASISSEATVDEARKADVQLQMGDVIEITPEKGWRDGPWKGFPVEVNKFIAKALSGAVQMIDRDGNVTIKSLDYRAPLWVETANGWAPVIDPEGIASFLGVLSANGSTIRRGDLEADARWAYLRDGDIFRAGPEPGWPQIVGACFTEPQPSSAASLPQLPRVVSPPSTPSAAILPTPRSPRPRVPRVVPPPPVQPFRR